MPTTRIMLIGGSAIAALLVIVGLIFAAKWPFSRGAVISRISRSTGAMVSIGRFRTTYFPPGFIAEDSVFKDPATRIPILTVRTLQVRTNYLALLRHRVTELRIAGFDLRPAEWRSRPRRGKSGESIRVASLIARDGSIAVPPAARQGKPLVIRLRQLALTGILEPVSTFQIAAASLTPPGEFHAQGKLQSLGSQPLDSVRVSGSYVFSDVDLSVFHPVAGKLASAGKLGGSLGRLQLNGMATVPDFRAAQGPHRVRLESAYTAVIDTATGDIALPRIQTSFSKTVVLATGNIVSKKNGGGKTLRLHARVDQGRIDDLLTLFSGNNRPGMTGSIRLDGAIEAPSLRAFLRSLRINGAFTVADAVFTNPKTESTLSRLSESADGATRAELDHHRAVIPAVLRGRVDDADGIAKLSMVHYSMPGVDASVQGTFDLLTKALNLNGLLTTTGQVREAESRWKSLLLLVGRPFLAIRRNRRTTYLAFHIKGTSRKPAFSVLHSYRQVAQDFSLCEVKQSCAKRIHAALTSAR